MNKKIKTKKSNGTPLVVQESSIADLRTKRIGGSINFRGIEFQLLYAVHTLLFKLTPDSDRYIHLEGIEDIDILEDVYKEYVQVKSSVNQIDAGKLWGLNVFQNFLEVYSKEPTSLFRLVHNTKFAKGNLDIITASHASETTVQFWREKFEEAGYSISSENVKTFFKQVTIEASSENKLYGEIVTLLYKRYSINKDTDSNFIKALFYNVFQWSKSRKLVSVNDLDQLIQSVRDGYAKFPSNPALQHNWITEVSYSSGSSISAEDYFEGKAARPVHIALGLPVKRPIWESEIKRSLEDFNITVIKSSSGQGKSTLAWQVGQTLSLQDHKVYQINYCPDWEQATAVFDFVETRLKIGETPLVIVDGLNRSVAGWEVLAKLCLDKPVKVLITAREEDWVRYGADVSKASLNTVNIKLTMTEAENIFQELHKNNKTHKDIRLWQPAWEKIGQKGLLLEYVYLLTSGEMLSDRLGYQMAQLQKELSAPAKTEILRLVSLADVMNIKIRTSKLTNYINNSVRFETDRNEVYRQLEKEYYLKFGLEYIEGLHPVRSKHLTDILHTNIEVYESLLILLELIDDESIYDYFIEAPTFLSQTTKERYYREVAVILAKRDFSAMVYSIDGLMHYEPARYWRENKDIYDEVFATGGIQLFVYDSVPFKKLNTLEKLSGSIGDILGNNIHFLVTKLKELSSYNFSQSDVLILIRHLHASLNEKKNIQNLEGIVFLSKWFKKAGFEFPDILDLNEQKLLGVLPTKEIGQSADLFQFFSITQPIAYKKMIGSHRETIIGWIKRKTNTLAISEVGNDIHITYLLDENADKANEYSVYRINIVHSFFPDYAHYCTEVKVLPFPYEEIFNVVIQNGRKAIPKENLFDDFDIHINQIWSKTVLMNYTSTSVYEWQRQYFDFRKNSIEVVRLCVRIFECILTKNSSRLKTVINDWEHSANRHLSIHQILKKYPSYNPKYFEKEKFTKEEGKIEGFFNSFRNFLNQMTGIFSPRQEQDRNLPIVNLKDAVYKLPEMQSAFNNITDNSYGYFPFESIVGQEKEWYTRLSHTAQFYVNYVKTGSTEKIIDTMRSVKQWWEAELKENLAELHAIIKGYEELSPFTFFLPTEIIEENNLRSVGIAVQGCDLTNKRQNDLFDLSMGLHKLTETGIHFFTFVFVDRNEGVVGSLRFASEYFERFNTLVETGEFNQEESFSLALPIIPEKTLLEKIEGDIHLKTVVADKNDEDYYKTMTTMWKLSEYRKNLLSSLPEKEWLEEYESIFSGLIRNYVDSSENSNSEPCSPTKEDITRFLDREIDYSKEKIVSFMLDRFVSKK
ncbi:dsDNA nuclease domain-containing protein [Paraflavitalea sp. CAU 1676]|uniref:dsDNA nuclease domain-containing protein n=1 Tax=Paraflavitalea sp. CAU 1676 TaxID=3032598 RepID=UPI0023D9DBBC|nr:dsDNA nuclease domain-containing protein [Paraflavitalea sp. CAU 1676]MDF2188305.1 hypothetical protein [Paraflavitalea sp. CAU 1676]